MSRIGDHARELHADALTWPAGSGDGTHDLERKVEMLRDIASWARATFDLCDRPDYGDGIDQLFARYGLEPLNPSRPHRRPAKKAEPLPLTVFITEKRGRRGA